jgi:flagellar biosynthetic protein FliR
MVPAPAIINLSSPALVSELMNLGQMLWITSIQLAGPIVLIIFLVDFAFGIVSRVAPQVNVFMLGFQVKPAVGVLALLFILPLFINRVGGLLGTAAEEVLKLLTALKL